MFRRVSKDAEKEEVVTKVAKQLLASNGHLVRSAEWSLANGILYFHGKVYIPDHLDLRWQIIALCHDTRHWNWCHGTTGGHRCLGT